MSLLVLPFSIYYRSSPCRFRWIARWFNMMFLDCRICKDETLKICMTAENWTCYHHFDNVSSNGISQAWMVSQRNNHQFWSVRKYTSKYGQSYSLHDYNWLPFDVSMNDKLRIFFERGMQGIEPNMTATLWENAQSVVLQNSSAPFECTTTDRLIFVYSR